MSVKKNSDGDLIIRHRIPAAVVDEFIEASVNRLNYQTEAQEGENLLAFIDRKLRAAYIGVLKTHRIKKEAERIAGTVNVEIE